MIRFIVGFIAALIGIICSLEFFGTQTSGLMGCLLSLFLAGSFASAK